MAFKTDCGGVAMTAEVKLSKASTTWNTRLSQIHRMEGDIYICTFSLCNREYISKILNRRSKDVTIICNSRYEANARQLKQDFPETRFFVNPNAHAKLVLIGPKTVWLSSENLGRKKETFDASIGIHSEEAYQHYLAQVQKLLRSRNTIEIGGTEECMQ